MSNCPASAVDGQTARRRSRRRTTADLVTCLPLERQDRADLTGEEPPADPDRRHQGGRTRKNGAKAIVTSSLRNSALVRKLMTFQVTLACVSITPFGRPVVPVVCGRNSRSSRSTAAPAWTPVDSAISDSYSSAPARVPPTAIRYRTDSANRGFWQRRVLEDDNGIRVRNDDRTLVAREVVVDGSKDGTDPPGREQRLEEGRVVLAEPRDPVAMRDAHAPECAREPADPLRKRGVRLLAVRGDERGTVRRAPGAPFDPRSDAEVPRAEPLHATQDRPCRIGKGG